MNQRPHGRSPRGKSPHGQTPCGSSAYLLRWASVFLLGCTLAINSGCRSLAAAQDRAAKLDASAVQRTAGWNILRLSGTPYQIGLAHGRALAPEIDDSIRLAKATAEHPDSDGHAVTWAWCRQITKEQIEPKIPAEYQDELRGIADGLRQAGFGHDYTDVVAYNAGFDLEYYHPVWMKQQGKPVAFHAPEHCSAFIATGKLTADGRIVAGHNDWSGFVDGQRTNVILDITPSAGHRFVMDTMPGQIHSGTDWFINDAGIIITETTIDGFEGCDITGMPEFVRARQAAQYASSIDDVYSWLVKKNNGAYANAWLIGDIKTNEIAKLELGLKNVIFHRTTQGAYVGANYPEDPKLTAEETTGFEPTPDNDMLVRKARWRAVLQENMGKIDAGLAKQFLGDTVDARTGKVGASMCTLCGRYDRADVGHGGVGPAGAVNAKATTAALAEHLSFWARMGLPDGASFVAQPELDGPHAKELAWMKPFLRDMPAQPWILVGGSAATAQTPIDADSKRAPAAPSAAPSAVAGH